MLIEKIAIVVDPQLPLGLLANTVATIGIGLGAVAPDLGGTVLTDADGARIHNSANRAVPILQATPETMAQILIKAQSPDAAGFIVAFPQFARSIHSFADYQALFPTKSLSSETIEGLGLAGPDKWVKSLTGSLKLLR
ncbi:DUF2000 domain-containing protein [Rhizobiales bacterium TNE-4]|nr:DUF2000 domain-containing protein [Rhizobiales bacterium TNE-4]MBV1827824.1 DUF2000 domain-containing protein [Rhizobiales bacterium TNE-4]